MPQPTRGVLCWDLTAAGDQQAWQDWCEQFMSTDITMLRRFVHNHIVVTCRIAINPYQPIDSTGSMPSLVDQAASAGFRLAVERVTALAFVSDPP